MITPISTVSVSPALNNSAHNTLAKLMASENIKISHDHTARTASFDTQSRMLTLPIWDGMPREVVEMLIAHEVGHALHTPTTADEIMGAINAIDATNPVVVKDFLNICEDVRIEKEIKNKFPGIRRQFSKGYLWMEQNGFFGTLTRSMSFADRANTHFKAGGYVGYFNPTEQSILDEMIATKSWDDVVAVAKRLYDYCTPDQQGEEEQEQAGKSEPQQGQQGQSDQSDGGGEGTPSGEKCEGNADSAKGSKPSDGKGKQGGNKKPQRPSTAQNQESALDKKVSTDCLGIKYVEFPKMNLDALIFDCKAIEKQLDITTTKVNAERKAQAGQTYNPMAYIADEYGSSLYNEFAKDSRGFILQLVRQFEMKMNADIVQRTSQSRTGNLDMRKIHAYRFIDDMFLRNEEISAGKNHGIVFYLDWSASMQGTLNNTITQMLAIVEFCRMVNIPYEVFAFSTRTACEELGKRGDDLPENQIYTLVKNAKGEDYWNKVEGITAKYDSIQTSGNDFGLLNFFSSRQSKLSHRTMAARLLQFSDLYDNKYSSRNKKQMGQTQEMVTKCRHLSNLYSEIQENNSWLSLDGTPLVQAVSSMVHIIPKFRAKYNLQVISAVFLSDGEASGSPFNLECKYVMNAKQTDQVYKQEELVIVHNGKEYRQSPQMYHGSMNRGINGWDSFLQTMRIILGINTVGFYIMHDSGRRLACTIEDVSVARLTKDDVAKLVKDFKSEGFVSLQRKGFDEYFIMKSDTESVTNEDMFEDVKAGDIKVAAKAFRDGQRSKVTSRIVLSKISSVLAKAIR